MFTNSPNDDKAQLLTFINQAYKSAYKKIGAFEEEAKIQSQKLDIIINQMYDDNSPLGLLGKASAFKKSAYFLLIFCQSKPIQNNFPNFGYYNTLNLEKYYSYQNEMIAFDFIRFMLQNSTIKREDKKIPIKLSRKISLSSHSYEDLIQTLSKLDSKNDYVLLSLLIEQMAYRDNPSASYKKDV